MSEGRGQGAWNKWEGPTALFAVGGNPFMPRKPLTLTVAAMLPAAGVDWVFNPPRLPRGERGVWGSAPRSLIDQQ